MKILFVNEKAGYFGGVEQNVADSARALAASGSSCCLAYGELTERDADGYRDIFQQAALCRELSPQGVAGQHFGDIMRQFQPDVVYLHKVAGLEFFMPFVGAVRSVRMVHDHDLCCPRRHKYFLFNSRVCHYRAGWRCYLDAAFLERDGGSPWRFRLTSIQSKLTEMKRNFYLDTVLVGSRFMRQELIQNGFSANKVHILPPVVPAQNLLPSPVPDCATILYVGQLIRGKGVDLLLQALKLMRCDYKAVIVGTGNAQDSLKALCRSLGLDNKVAFHGWIDHMALAAYYADARVVAVPSRWPEPFGMIGLEAMRQGRPVVAFDVGGIADWLQDGVTGCLVAEQDIKGFGRALERLLHEPETAREMGHKALAAVHDRFSFDGYVNQLSLHLKGNGITK